MVSIEETFSPLSQDFYEEKVCLNILSSVYWQVIWSWFLQNVKYEVYFRISLAGRFINMSPINQDRAQAFLRLKYSAAYKPDITIMKDGVDR